jgi:glucose/arabinose dehydrogenase
LDTASLVSAATTLSLTYLLGSITLALFRPSLRIPAAVSALLAAAMLAAILILDQIVHPGHNSLLFVTRQVARRNPFHLCAILLGAGSGVLASAGISASFRRALLAAAGATGIFLSLSALAGASKLATYWSHRGLSSIAANPTGVTAPKGFEISEYHTCSAEPIQLAAGPGNKLYYCTRGGNAVVRLDEDPAGGVKEVPVARDLGTVHGLAFFNGLLHVSRSGRHTKAAFGKLLEQNTGAVTMLRDVDGDGMSDYFHDIVGDLPGSQGPDPVHQNNGIVFAPGGTLFVAVGANSDKEPATGEFEGSVVRLLPGARPEVFARGMRNPFDCAVGPEDELFCTDNDVGYSGFDELNHVVAGGHYGHPYVDPYKNPEGIHPKGTIGPIWAQKQTSLQGLTYATSPRLPEPYRNCLYVAAYPSGEIYRIRLRREGSTFRAEADVFANVPHALDVTVDMNGTFYVSSNQTRKIFRIRPASGVAAK